MKQYEFNGMRCYLNKDSLTKKDQQIYEVLVSPDNQPGLLYPVKLQTPREDSYTTCYYAADEDARRELVQENNPQRLLDNLNEHVGLDYGEGYRFTNAAPYMYMACSVDVYSSETEQHQTLEDIIIPIEEMAEVIKHLSANQESYDLHHIVSVSPTLAAKLDKAKDKFADDDLLIATSAGVWAEKIFPDTETYCDEISSYMCEDGSLRHLVAEITPTAVEIHGELAKDGDIESLGSIVVDDRDNFLQQCGYMPANAWRILSFLCQHYSESELEFVEKFLKGRNVSFIKKD